MDYYQAAAAVLQGSKVMSNSCVGVSYRLQESNDRTAF